MGSLNYKENYNLNSYYGSSKASKTTPVYNLSAGVSFPLSSNLNLNLAYKIVVFHKGPKGIYNIYNNNVSTGTQNYKYKSLKYNFLDLGLSLSL
jgi:opacity protein-like surface antigen